MPATGFTHMLLAAAAFFLGILRLKVFIPANANNKYTASGDVMAATAEISLEYGTISFPGSAHYRHLVEEQATIYRDLDPILKTVERDIESVREEHSVIEKLVRQLTGNHSGICASGDYVPVESSRLEELFTKTIFFFNEAVTAANNNGYSRNRLPYIEIGSEWENFRRDKEDACREYTEFCRKFREQNKWSANPWIRDTAPESV